MAVGARYCKTCGARLASDNAEETCRPCQRAAHESSRCPPDVPAEFWDNDRLRDALVRERHMGHAVQSYRKHPHFGHRHISQEVAARWLSISQTQLSRIEKGRPIYDLDRLVQWAKTLGIPPDLLWFALPDDGDSVKRRQFLAAGGAAAVGVLSGDLAHGSHPALSEEECAQWLAWELWNRKATALPGKEMPAEIRGTLGDVQPGRSLILRDAGDNYSFAHQSLVDFFVAQRIFGDLADGKSELLATAQTSHDTDQVIRRFVQHQDSCIPILSGWMNGGTTPILRVNSAGILAKLGSPSIADDVITTLRKDADTRHLYLTAVASRVLTLPWDNAARLAGVSEPADELGISTDHAAELAFRLSEEVRQSPDGAARWCSVVLLNRIAKRAPIAVASSLQEALSREPCRENLRAIGAALSDSDPTSI